MGGDTGQSMTKSRTKGQRRAASKAQRQRAAMTRAADGRRIIAPTPEPAVIGPTPERLAKAQGAAVVGEDRVTRIRDGIIDRLASSGRLWPDDPERNRALYSVALELQRVYRLAGLDASPTSVNLLAAGGGSGDKPYLTPTTEAAAGARVRLRSAYDAVPRAMWTVTVAVVIADHDLVSAGSAAASGLEDDKGVRAIARYNLREGLAAIGRHWGYRVEIREG